MKRLTECSAVVAVAFGSPKNLPFGPRRLLAEGRGIVCRVE